MVLLCLFCCFAWFSILNVPALIKYQSGSYGDNSLYLACFTSSVHSGTLILPDLQNTHYMLICIHYKARERSGSVVECLTRELRPRVRATPTSLPCVLEQDTLILV